MEFSWKQFNKSPSSHYCIEYSRYDRKGKKNKTMYVILLLVNCITNWKLVYLRAHTHAL
jgi:hypothetical protein